MVSHNKDSTKSILGETLVWKSCIKLLKRDVAIAGHVEKSRWRPLTSLQKLAPILGSSQHDFGGETNQKVGMMKLGMTHLRILFFLHDHALEKTPSSNITTCWQQTIIWLIASNFATFGQLCSSLGTSETSRFARLQDDWKLTPIDYARTSGKTNPKSHSRRDDELLRRLKMVTTRRWQRYNDT